MNRSSANRSRDVGSRIKGRGSMSEKVAVIGVTLMCQMCFLQHSVFVKYVNRSRGDVTQLEPHCSASLMPKPTSHLSAWTVSTSNIHWNLLNIATLFPTEEI